MQIDLICARSLSLPGAIVLRTPVAVEELGGRKNLGTSDGPELGDHIGGGEEAQEEAIDRLHVCQSEAPQLLGISVLLL